MEKIRFRTPLLYTFSKNDVFSSVRRDYCALALGLESGLRLEVPIAHYSLQHLLAKAILYLLSRGLECAGQSIDAAFINSVRIDRAVACYVI